VRLNQAALLTFVLVLPVSVDAPSRDSTSGGETRVSLTGSVGRYALIDRGCEGQVLDTHPHEYSESALEATHVFDNGFAVGVRAGVLREEITDREKYTDYSGPYPRDTVLVYRSDWHNSYVNPTIGYEGRTGAIGVGVITARRPFVFGEPDTRAALYGSTGINDTKVWPTFHLRGGRRDGRYLRFAFMESVPLYSGGGYFDLGLGSHLSRRWDLYAGLSGGPFDGPGLALQTEYRALPNLAIHAKTRLGSGGGENQSGIALGVTYVSRPPVAPTCVEPPRGYRSRMWVPERDTVRK